MVAWVLRSGRPGVFDPCFGAGAFLEAARRAGAARIEGMEIDPDLFGPRNGHADDPAPASVVLGDYLRSWGQSHPKLAARHYGDALDKFEPGDLTQVSAPDPEMLSRLTPEDRERALAEVARTGRTPAWTDDFFDEIRAASTTRTALVPRAPGAAADGADAGRKGSFPGFPPPGGGDAGRVRP